VYWFCMLRVYVTVEIKRNCYFWPWVWLFMCCPMCYEIYCTLYVDSWRKSSHFWTINVALYLLLERGNNTEICITFCWICIITSSLITPGCCVYVTFLFCDLYPTAFQDGSKDMYMSLLSQVVVRQEAFSFLTSLKNHEFHIQGFHIWRILLELF